MTKDNNVNIKLEVYKDKTSGKLSIMAHFDSDAPNVTMGKDGYFWVPTTEENDLIMEAFELIPLEGSPITSIKTTQEAIETKEKNSKEEPTVKETFKSTPSVQSNDENTEPDDLQPLKNQRVSDEFEITDDQINKDDLEKNVNNKIEDVTENAEEETSEISKSDKQETEIIEKDEEFIVEADSKAIEAALKKNLRKDESIVEADEKTIIDKVLSQKKKGKWSKR